MIYETELSSLFCFDLETSSEYESFAELEKHNPRKAELWKAKHDKSMQSKSADQWKKFTKGDEEVGFYKDYNESYLSLAPLNAEFGRIVCASFGYLSTATIAGKQTYVCKLKSFYDTQGTETSEKTSVLEPISSLLTNIHKAGKHMKMTGHNIKKFDVPWLVRRMTMSNVPVPTQLQTWGKKPWEIDHLDTGELWALGNWDGYVTLDLLSCALNVPSPKSEMKGEYVGKTFWVDNDYEKIRKYCEEDVKCVVRICHTLSKSELEIVFDQQKITA